MNIGWTELVIVFLILLLLFGSRLPDVGRSLGKGIKSFKDGLSGVGGDEGTDRKDSEPQDAYASQGEAADKEAGEAAESVPSEGKDRAG
jgi:sec-independent protein translocase protein TatA